MTTATPQKKQTPAPPETVVNEASERPRWNPWLGVVFVILVYFLSQFISSIIVSLYPFAKHWSMAEANNWLQNSILAQFFYVLLAEGFTIGAIYGFLRLYKQRFSSISFKRPHLRDFGYGILIAPVYYFVYLLATFIVSALIPAFKVNETQQIGFTGVHGVAQLVLTGISLVILPPLAEEIMVRGFLYSSLRKGMPKIAAVIVTSAIFASAHLPEGGAAGPLWNAALETFILSLTLLYLREKTQNLWAGMTLHAVNNGVAYYILYLSPLLAAHLRA